MTNGRNNVLYIGVTTDLERRVAGHKLCLTPGFTSRYRCTKLVYLEASESILDALAREKQLKNWQRAWKDTLVRQANPGWRDSSSTIGVTPAVLAHLAQSRHSTARDAGSSPA